MARTSAQTEARQRARAKLAKASEARRKRDQDELAVLMGFETAADRRAAAEADMAAAVASLISLGNTVARTAELTDLTETEIRRLRKCAAEAASGEQAEATVNAIESAVPGSDTTDNGAPTAARATEDGQDALEFDISTRQQLRGRDC